MQRDYYYIETPDDTDGWPKEFIQALDIEEHNDLFEFNVANLNSTEPAQKQDCSE